MTDLMYLSSTTSICHTREKDVKTTANKMYFSHSIVIHCIQHLVVKSTSLVHLEMRCSKKSKLLQQKYLQCGLTKMPSLIRVKDFLKTAPPLFRSFHTMGFLKR